MPLNDPAKTERFILSTNAQLAEANVTPNTHPLLVVFDMYSKCTPGSDENNTKDVKGIYARELVEDEQIVLASD